MSKSRVPRITFHMLPNNCHFASMLHIPRSLESHRQLQELESSWLSVIRADCRIPWGSVNETQLKCPTGGTLNTAQDYKFVFCLLGRLPRDSSFER